MEAADGRFSWIGLVGLSTRALGDTGEPSAGVPPSFGVEVMDLRLLWTDERWSSMGGSLLMELVKVLVLLLARAGPSDPTSLPYVCVVLRVDGPCPLTSSCRDLIFCQVLSLLPTEPRSKAFIKTEVWSMPKITSPVISWSLNTSQWCFSTPAVNRYSAT